MRKRIGCSHLSQTPQMDLLLNTSQVGGSERRKGTRAEAAEELGEEGEGQRGRGTGEGRGHEAPAAEEKGEDEEEEKGNAFTLDSQQ